MTCRDGEIMAIFINGVWYFYYKSLICGYYSQYYEFKKRNIFYIGTDDQIFGE